MADTTPTWNFHIDGFKEDGPLTEEAIKAVNAALREHGVQHVTVKQDTRAAVLTDGTQRRF